MSKLSRGSKNPPALAVGSVNPFSSILGEQRVVLQGVSWETFQQLLTDLGAPRSTRLAYSHRILEIMSPLDIHERIKILLGRLILTWAEIHDLDVEGVGSWTMQREDLSKGAEADECYYIQNASAIWGLERIDLTGDLQAGRPPAPPPDLAIEVDITNSSTLKLPIYQSLGIPEVWHWAGPSLQVKQLIAGEYQVQNTSRVLPGFPVDQVTGWVLEGLQMGQSAIVRKFRAQIRQGYKQ